MAGGKGSLAQDLVIKRLIPDPGDIPDLVTVSGWLGDSTKRNSLRLYLNLSFDFYLEIPEKTVAHWAKLGDGDLQGTILWVPRESKVQMRSRNASVTIKAGYLRGSAPRSGALLGTTEQGTTSPWPNTRYIFDCWAQPMILESEP